MVLLIIVLLAVLLYTWLGYPLILRLVAGRSPSPPTSHTPSLPLPPVTILLAAYNEEAHIAARLENLLALDYPPDRIVVHLGLDGCSDGTASIAGAFAESHPNIHAHDYSERRGKVAVIKKLVENRSTSSSEEILMFSDANTHFHPDALKKMVSHFSDPSVGGVCGRLIFTNSREKVQESQKGSGRFKQKETKVTKERLNRSSQRTQRACSDGIPPVSRRTSRQNRLFSCTSCREMSILRALCDFLFKSFPSSPEGAYWGWETKLKLTESRLDSCIGANGAIYAMRADLFWCEIPNNTLIDDFVLGVKVREQGFRMVYEPDAIAEEELPDVAHEWNRRVRIGAGAYQALSLCRRSLIPMAEGGKLKAEEKPILPISAFSFQLSAFLFPWMFWSHKVLRWFTPHMLLALFVLSIVGLISTAWRFHPYSNTPTLQHSIALSLQSLPLFFFLAGGVARLLRNTVLIRLPLLKPLRLLDHFLTMQAALFAGFVGYCRGGLKGAWTRTPRSC